jgi:hypothetical protein
VLRTYFVFSKRALSTPANFNTESRVDMPFNGIFALQGGEDVNRAGTVDRRVRTLADRDG